MSLFLRAGSAGTRRASVTTLLSTIVVLLASLAASLFLAGPASAATYHSATSWERSVAGRVEAQLNAERHAHGVPRVYMNSQLQLSSRRHDYTMSRYSTLSHQLPHEAFFASRISTAGYRWSWAGENIGYSTALSTSAVLGLETEMYNERPPNDGHRVNILNRHFHDVGIDVFVDSAHHKVFLTVDFGHH